MNHASVRVPQFGEQLTGAEYVLRPGAYTIIRRDTGEIAVVTTPGGTFLPGGGLEPGETPEQAATREVREECGMQICLGAAVGMADELVYAGDEGRYFRKRCAFFAAEFAGFNGNASETDHALSWLTPEVAARQLTHGSQRWALAAAMG